MHGFVELKIVVVLKPYHYCGDNGPNVQSCTEGSEMSFILMSITRYSKKGEPQFLVALIDSIVTMEDGIRSDCTAGFLFYCSFTVC